MISSKISEILKLMWLLLNYAFIVEALSNDQNHKTYALQGFQGYKKVIELLLQKKIY